MAAIPEAWVGAMVFGNIWALFWVLTMLFTYSPGLWSTIFGTKKEKKPAATTEMSPISQPSRKRVSRKNTETQMQEIANDFKSALSQEETVASNSRAKDHENPAPFPSEPTTGNTNEPGAIMRRITRMPTLIIPGLELEWRDVGCQYKMGSTNKIVLEGIYGCVKPREMMALMGPSGAGKSTLLDILTMRKTVGIISGEVLMNGHGREGNFLRMSSYVPQEDNFIPTMTTLETLNFYARLVIPTSTSRAQRRRRVDEVLFMVGLDNSRDTMVGGMLPGGIHLRGLSGGERRRLSIAAGVVSAPSIIFLDEPTSGLDSFAALNVMQYMKSLAECKSHTVIASIHQPRMSIWNMFNKVTILSKGKLMYSGETNRVVSWFTTNMGYDYEPSIHGVVSDWVIDLVSIGFSKPHQYYGKTMRNEDELHDAAAQFYADYKSRSSIRSDQLHEDGRAGTPEQDLPRPAALVRKKTTHFLIEVPTSPDLATQAAPATQKASHAKVPVFNPGYPTSWLTQFFTLTWRSLLNVTRNPADVAGRMLTFTYVGAFIGAVFYNMPDSLASVQTRLNIIFNTASFFMFIPYTSMSLFTSDRQFYAADVTAKLYHSSAYYIANVVSNFPFAVLNAAVFGLVVYGMAGLNDDFEAIWKHVVLAVIESLISLQVLHFAAVATHNQDTAFMVAISFTAVNVIVSNFFIPFQQINLKWISWLKYISAMGYTFNGALQLEFRDRNFSCNADDLENINPNDTQNFESTLENAFPNLKQSLPLSSLTPFVVQAAGEDCVFDGSSVLDYFNVDRPYFQTVGILIGYLCVLHVLTFLALIFLAKKDKR